MCVLINRTQNLDFQVKLPLVSRYFNQSIPVELKCNVTARSQKINILKTFPSLLISRLYPRRRIQRRTYWCILSYLCISKYELTPSRQVLELARVLYDITVHHNLNQPFRPNPQIKIAFWETRPWCGRWLFWQMKVQIKSVWIKCFSRSVASSYCQSTITDWLANWIETHI